ncbi:sugar ABC transporter permease [Haloparvum alkalitolerans]|uniref:carbohydrate ABC transporter permease n=1 Tax=Haloparvum alkalitolerans TaxID=1042953 RepID=UPI003CF35CD0
MLGGLFGRSDRDPDDAESDEERRSRSGGERQLRADGGATASAATGTDASILTRLRRSEFVESLPFWGPPAVLVGIFVYGAVAWNLVISLIGWDGLGQPEYTDFSLAAYEQLLVDPSFTSAFWNTLILLLLFTVLSLAVGLLLAILIDRGIRFENTFRTIYLLPMSLSFVVTAIFWSWMYNPRIGLINTALRGVGLDVLTTAWLSNPDVKLFAIIFALMWQFSGYCMVVYLAGLRAIPRDQYEAARIDGASTLRVYLRVIIPQLGASTMSAAVVLMVFALKAFDFLFVLFGVNPGQSADILSVMMYRVAFDRLQWSYGAAVATVLFAMALSVIGPYLYAQYRRGEL